MGNKKDKNVKLLITSWKQVSIADYNELVEICSDTTTDENTKTIKVLAVLCNEDEDTIWNLPLPKVADLTSKIGWLNNFKFPKGKIINNLHFEGWDLKVNTDLQQMTVAQYVDFQTYYAKGVDDGNMANILSTFIIPKGKKYGEDYDVREVIRLINNHLSISDAEAILFFFTLRSLISIWVIKIYLVSTLRIARKIMRKKNNKEIELKLRQAEETLSLLGG